MATTTTNFGWDIPQSTDLVKDGATAIAALGQDIDTAFIDLKGGTTGQVLAKASGTDLDFSWVAQDDSNAIQNAIVDAKGDLIAATAADTPARLGVGTNGQVLTADSTAATGLVWATPAGASGPAFLATRTGSNQSGVSSGTYTKLQGNNESFDTDGCYDPSTNYRFTPNKAGYYQMNITTYFATATSSNNGIYMVKNGIGNIGNMGGPTSASATSFMSASYSTIVYMNGTTDYVEAWCYLTSAGGGLVAPTDGYQFSGAWIRS